MFYSYFCLIEAFDNAAMFVFSALSASHRFYFYYNFVISIAFPFYRTKPDKEQPKSSRYFIHSQSFPFTKNAFYHLRLIFFIVNNDLMVNKFFQPIFSIIFLYLMKKMVHKWSMAIIYEVAGIYFLLTYFILWLYEIEFCFVFTQSE